MRLPVLISLALLATGVAAAPAQADTWFATPNGGGANCTQQDPCDAAYALGTKGQDGDTVVLAGGDYQDLFNPVTIDHRISIEGAASGAPTRLHGTSNTAVIIYNGSASTLPVHITDIQVIGEVNFPDIVQITNAVDAPILVDRSSFETLGTSSTPLVVHQSVPGSGILVRNSIARGDADDNVAIRVVGPSSGSGTVELRNLIGEARAASSGVGMQVFASATVSSCGNLTVNMKNTYLHAAQGPQRDINVRGSSFSTTQCSSTLQSSNSNWRDRTLTPPASSVFSTNDQHSLDPLFVNAAGGDYREAAGSPTIDAGVNDGQLGSLDFAHAARIQGPSPDIGAFETAVPVPPAPAPADKTPSVGSALAAHPFSFVPDRKKPPAGSSRKKRKKKTGTTISYKLSEAATVSFTVQRRIKGRKKGKKCKVHRKHGKRCTFYRRVKGSFKRAGTAGKNRFHFSGWIGGRKLKKGRYRMTGLPTDAAGNKGSAFSGSFKIKRR